MSHNAIRVGIVAFMGALAVALAVTVVKMRAGNAASRATTACYMPVHALDKHLAQR